MKLKFKLLCVTCIFLTLLMIQPFSSIASVKNGGGENDKEKKSAKARTHSSRNNNSVRIYPGVVKRALHVVAKGNDGKEIDFFVFDLEGTLMQHYKMETGDHQKITGLSRGKYIYRVFSGDEETATGELEIR